MGEPERLAPGQTAFRARIARIDPVPALDSSVTGDVLRTGRPVLPKCIRRGSRLASGDLGVAGPAPGGLRRRPVPPGPLGMEMIVVSGHARSGLEGAPTYRRSDSANVPGLTPVSAAGW